MFAIAGLIPLIVLIYLRPQEFFHALEDIPFLYLFTLLSAFGLAIDLRMKRARVDFSPQLPWAMAFLVWIVISTVFSAPGEIVIAEVIDSVIGFALFFLVAHGAQSLRSLRAVFGTVVLCVVFLVALGVHQGLADKGCILLDESNMGALQTGTFDGRPCSTSRECYTMESVPGGDYACEHIGALGTNTVKGRIRYRGILQDPNELGMAISIGIPLLLALAYLRRQIIFTGLTGLVIVGAGVALYMTQSRSGQLVFVVVLGVYFIKRFRWLGAGVAGLIGMAAIALGGRTGAEADSSVSHRLESWQAGMDMLKSSPALGVGKGMFVENNFLTAHNSYVLAAAELGVIGYVLWAILVYISFKIPLQALRTLKGPETQSVRILALSLLAALAGISVSMLFLSLTYHYVLAIYLGLCGALYTSIRRHEPHWRISFGLWDAALAVGGAAALLATVAVYLRYKGL